jgi:hypothetical protein
MHIIRLATAMVLATAALTANAADSDVAVHDLERVTINNPDGLVEQVPAHKTRELLGQVRDLHSNLSARQVELEKSVKFEAKDVIITVIMPGGLAYAAHKKIQQKKAETELKNITTELAQLSKDILMLETVSGERSLAMLLQP